MPQPGQVLRRIPLAARGASVETERAVKVSKTTQTRDSGGLDWGTEMWQKVQLLGLRRSLAGNILRV